MEDNMKQIKKLLKKIEDNLKIQVFICLTLFVIIIAYFLITYNYITENKIRKYTIVDDIKLINDIEDISTNSDNISLSGFAFLLDMDSVDSSISLFLRNVSNGKEVWMHSEKNVRPDINLYFNCEYNYGNSGFFAKVKKEKLYKDQCYEVLVNLDYYNTSYKKVRKTVSTNRYILNGELYAYNPYEYDEPDNNLMSNLLRNVFLNGRLCFYQKDAGMYVYQYEGKLYWFANKDFVFDESGLTYISCHFYTSQANKLMTESIPLKYSNWDFYFEKQEYTEEDTVPYRVAIRDIPEDYAITYIMTGDFDPVNKVSTWTKYFHIDNIH